LVDVLLPVFTFLGEAVKAAFDFMVPIVRDALEIIGQIIQMFVDTVEPIFSALWDGFTTVVTVAFEVIENTVEVALAVIRGLFDAGKALLQGDFGAIWDALKGIVTDAMDAIGDLVSTSFDAIIEFISGIPGKILDFATEFLSISVQLGESLVAGFLDLAPEVIKGLVTMIFDVGSWIINTGIPKLLGYGADLGKSILDGLTDGLSSALSGLGGVAKSVVNSIIDLINSAVIDSINDLLEFKIPGPFGTSITINPPDIPNIPKLADGGIVTSPTLALIGEAGPEAVVPLSSARAPQNLGGSTFNITVQSGVGDPGAIGQSVVEAITAYERRNGAGWRAA